MNCNLQCKKGMCNGEVFRFMHVKLFNLSVYWGFGSVLRGCGCLLVGLRQFQAMTKLPKILLLTLKVTKKTISLLLLTKVADTLCILKRVKTLVGFVPLTSEIVAKKDNSCERWGEGLSIMADSCCSTSSGANPIK